MTMTRPAREVSAQVDAARVASPIEWVRIQSGLWVGKSGGEFAGMIENSGGEFTAVRLSKPIGTYATLAEAKRAFSA
ncbi:hypothetical protein HDC94_000074 [Leifsonia sp. AK011]|uniref:hypothetical protein n=1 Tax=Leifsonia sp. AK011 TaxID=2723075 RepID=UPI0015C88760|nr:hypothetical protein [Leifsonia sp. AK011]NYF08918.1 hypothetical protein [Leifsonia sp. AK011]